jgi:phage baseplate assembly protein gpV
VNELIQRNAADVIRDVHMLAEEMGFHRVRVDRSQYEDGAWIEVGYASAEIHVRTSDPKLVYRRAVDKVAMDDVIALIEDLLDQEGPQ